MLTKIQGNTMNKKPSKSESKTVVGSWEAAPAWAKAGLPSPENLTQDAAMEDEVVSPEDYLDTISVLRGKGWSWRRIAAWFGRRGFDFSHVALYRAWNDHEELKGEE
jgi:hypothetical protein